MSSSFFPAIWENHEIGGMVNEFTGTRKHGHGGIWRNESIANHNARPLLQLSTQKHTDFWCLFHRSSWHLAAHLSTKSFKPWSRNLFERCCAMRVSRIQDFRSKLKNWIRKPPKKIELLVLSVQTKVLRFLLVKQFLSLARSPWRLLANSKVARTRGSVQKSDYKLQSGTSLVLCVLCVLLICER